MFIVGIGASAGGLEAIERFFLHMPARADMSFVVVQHLSPDVKSMMGELLSRRTRMPVMTIGEGMAVKPGVVYLNPPRMNTTITGGVFHPKAHEDARLPHLPIDFFFRSLAEDQGARSVAIILSGTGSDGSIGVRAIKDRDGLVLVQPSLSAQFDGMPSSAIRTGVVDLVLPPEEMGDRLAAYAELSGRRGDATAGGATDPELEGIGQILRVIRRTMLLDLSYYKLPTIRSRIERRMHLYPFPDVVAYARFLSNNPEEVERLFHDLLIGVTRFFRDPEAFARLSEGVIPDLLASAKSGSPVRIWVAACSTGEEAYSIGMLFLDAMRDMETGVDFRIYATDIDQNALTFAKIGLYPGSIAADVPRDRLERYFIREDAHFRVCGELRERIVFASHNLIQDPPFNRMHLVSCRNLLIYLQPVLQSKVLGGFRYALRDGGYLFLGPSESVGEQSHTFETIDRKWKVFRQAAKDKENGTEQRFPHEARSSRAGVGAVLEASKGVKRLETRNPAVLKDQLHQALLQKRVGPAVVVDEAGTVLLLVGGVARYLTAPDGVPTDRLDEMLDARTAISMRLALGSAFEDSARVRFQYARIQPDGGESNVEVGVEPLSEIAGGARLALVRFSDKAPPDASVEFTELALNDESMLRIQRLERELKQNQIALRESIDALEASNEELLSANEELQSTNEELHSVNRELISLNAEYQARITELTELNDDMANFLGNTRIGTLFLDRTLCIRKFTQSVRLIVHLMDQDAGRPLGHLAHRLPDTDLVADCRQVLETTEPIRKPVRDDQGNVYLMDVLPYRTRENQIKGVVVSFVNITGVSGT